MELREVIGDDHVDLLVAARTELDVDVMSTALDALQLLVGWVDEDVAGHWFTQPQRRLADRTPLAALVDGDTDEVMDAARAWVAAQA